jgi:hypothetical protein
MRESAFRGRRNRSRAILGSLLLRKCTSSTCKIALLPPRFGWSAAAPQLRRSCAFDKKGHPGFRQRDGPSALWRLSLVYLIVTNYVLEDLV